MAVIEGVHLVGGKSLFSVIDFYDKHAKEMGLELLAGRKGLSRPVIRPEVERPGLSLSGCMKGSTHKILIFGRAEMQFLKNFPDEQRDNLVKDIFFETTPLVLVCRNLRPFKGMLDECEKKNIPLMRSPLPAMHVMATLFHLLEEWDAPSLSCHGSMVEIFGAGILIQGDAAVGKSEAALGLIKRGHRLIADDIVKIKKNKGNILEGFGVETSQHQMEIKEVGIINIAHLFGVASVCEKKNLDIVVKLEVWNDSQFYDRNGLKENTISFLGVVVPFYLIHVKAGRDTVLLLETIALNHRIKNLSVSEQKGKTWSSI